MMIQFWSQPSFILPVKPHPSALEPMLCDKASHHNEKTMRCIAEAVPLTTTGESLGAAKKTLCSKNKSKSEN